MNTADTLTIDRAALLKSWFPRLYEDAMQKGLDKGQDEGREEERAAARQAIVQLLQARFGDIPQSIVSDLERVCDSAELVRLAAIASTATSPEEVVQAIRLA